jgi:Flp pilus assembly protein TadD
MSIALRRPLAAMIILACAGCSPTADRVKATVTTIDRTCDFVETAFEGKKAVSTRGYTDSCNSTDEWAKVREKRNKRVAGRATLHLSYVAPQDGSQQTGEIKLTGGDDAFYEIKAGDEIEILVSKSDPTRIRQA